MYSKTKYIFITISVLIFALTLQITYLHNSSIDDENQVKKNSFVKLISLPDLSIATESSYIRHRSLSNRYAIFSDGVEHIEYFPTTFTISHGINYAK
jgi:hypothetical protein